MTDRPLLLDTLIYLDGVPVRLTVAHWGDCGTGTVFHFEYHSVAEPSRPIPVSETGYKSDFLIAPETLSPIDLEEYARAFCAMLLEGIIRDQPEQPGLFG